MKKAILVGVVFLALAATCVSAAEKGSPQMPEGLAEAIDKAIALLEAGNAEEFIKQFAYPPDLKKILETQTMDKLVGGFTGESAKDLLEALKFVRNRTPEPDPGGSATFAPVEGKLRRALVFEKFDGKWYIRD